MSKKPRQRKANWEAIEREYRAGKLSIEEIARQHGITSAAIRKKAKKHGWTRDLEAKVDNAVKGYLVPIGIKVESSGTGSDEDGPQARAEAKDAEFVDYAARRMADVVLTHRRRIARASELSERLFEELEEQTTGRNIFEQLIEVLYATPEGAGPDAAIAAAMARSALKQHLALGNRAKILTNLAASLATLTKLERQAYGIAEQPEKGIHDPIEIEQQREAATVSHSDEDLAKAVLSIIERAARAKAEGQTKH